VSVIEMVRRLPYDVRDKLNLNLFFVNSKGEVDFYDWKRLKKEQSKN
jgi:hypothetical protein